MVDTIDQQVELAAIAGLTLADCLTFFDRKATPEEREKAALVDTTEGRFEVDNALISESDDNNGDNNGCYVLGWRWVDFIDTKFDKYPTRR